VDTSPPEEETAGSTTMGDSSTGTETGTETVTETGTETGTGSSSSGQ